jgi:hypothetical protein
MTGRWIIGAGVLAALGAWALTLNVEPAEAQTRRQTFNIYASLPMADPNYIQKGNVTLGRLQRCGIMGQTDETRNMPDLAPNLYVVFSGPHRSAQDARATLDKAKGCGLEGYTRQTRQIGD